MSYEEEREKRIYESGVDKGFKIGTIWGLLLGVTIIVVNVLLKIL